MASYGGNGGSSGSLGMFSALLFNLAILAMPFAAVNAWQSLQSSEIYSYDLTDASKAATRRALEDAAATLIPENADRKAYWSSLVQREIDAGDFAAARGLLLSARTMLDPVDSGRLEAQLPANADDKMRIEGALIFLDDKVRQHYEDRAAAIGVPTSATDPAGTPPAPTDALAGAVASDFALLGDAHDLADQSARWVQGEPIDVFALTLSGVGVALSAANPNSTSPAKIGASVVKAAKSTGKLSPAFTAQIQQRLFAAVPPDRLKQELDKVFAKDTPSDKAITGAFRASMNPTGYNALSAELSDIKAIADGATPAGAVRLLAHANDVGDLKKLRLIAEAGGDRGIAVAKRADRAALLGAAKGTLKMTNRLWLDFGALGLTLFIFALSVFATLGQALLLEWRHGQEHEEEDDYATA